MKRNKLLIMILALCLAVSCFLTTGYAADEGTSEAAPIEQGEVRHLSTGMRSNPLYSSAPEVSADAVEKPVAARSANTDVITDPDTAAAVVREGMKAREGAISFTYQVNQADCSGTNAAIQALFDGIFQQAMAHTGDPTEGDSLRWVYNSEGIDITYSMSGDMYIFDVTYLVTYYTTQEQELELTAQVDELVPLLQLDRDLTDYQKVVNIYSYICSNVSYDFAHLYDEEYALQYTAYAALVNKTAVCQGYAALFYRLALEAGVDARMIVGTALSDSQYIKHAWNIVKIGDLYYNLDSTWDTGLPSYIWFLKNSSDFVLHYPESTYTTAEFSAAYPLAATSYSHVNLTDQTQGDFVYSVSLGKATLTKYTGNETDVVVPAELGGYPVDRIAHAAFYCNMDIQTISFSEGIRYMDGEAVYGCHSLRKVTFPSTMYLTFDDPEGNVFSGCGAPVVSCPALAEITVAEGNPNIVVYDGALYSADMRVLLLLPAADPREEFRVPDGVVGISSDSCRDNTNLKRVILPDTVKTIGYWSFIYSSNLEQINIPESCTFIGQYAFENTAIKSLHIPASTTIILGGAFGMGCRPETITVDENNPVYYAVDNALYARGEDGDSLIKYAAGSGKTEFSVPAGVVSINWYAFADADNLQRVNLPTGLTTIAHSAFFGCDRLKTVVLPEGLQRVDDRAFWDCYSLKRIVFPASVRTVDEYLFANCTVDQIYFAGDAPEFAPRTFAGCRATVYYPGGNATWTDNVMQQYGGSITWKTGTALHGWVKQGSNWYYYLINEKQTGWLRLDDNWYLFDADGAMQTGWQKVSGTWYYFKTDGTMATGWQSVGGTWYYFKTDGAMATGWQSVSGTWYYFKTDGTMATGWQKVGTTWYLFGADGVMQTGWQKVGGTWYYFKADGAMAIGWQSVSGVWYYFKADGTMATGWQKVGTTWYLFDADGAMQTGWQKVGGTWYYFKADGAMAIGWQALGGIWYYFKADGAMATGWQKVGTTWYLFNADGVMQTGWQKVSGTWYYLHSSGAMATGTVTLGGVQYVFSASGALQS